MIMRADYRMLWHAQLHYRGRVGSKFKSFVAFVVTRFVLKQWDMVHSVLASQSYGGEDFTSTVSARAPRASNSLESCSVNTSRSF